MSEFLEKIQKKIEKFPIYKKSKTLFWKIRSKMAEIAVLGAFRVPKNVPICFFRIRFYKTLQTSTNIQLLEFKFRKNLQNTEKFRLFCLFSTFEAEARPQHSKFCKVVEQKLFLISVRIF
jgi:hypothetical protein